MAYELGHGVTQDYAEAIYWFRKSAEQGNSNGESDLAAAYYFGYGVPKSYAKAVYYYKLAAAQGNASAEKNLMVIESGGNVEAIYH